MFPCKSFSKRQKSKILLTWKARVLVWVSSHHAEHSSYSFPLWASTWLGREPSRALSGWHFPLHGRCAGSWTAGDLRIWTALWKQQLHKKSLLEREPGEPNGEERKGKDASLTHCRNTFSGLSLLNRKVSTQTEVHHPLAALCFHCEFKAHKPHSVEALWTANKGTFD